MTNKFMNIVTKSFTVLARSMENDIFVTKANVENWTISPKIILLVSPAT